jgi:sugar lactone lactonase YvrE
MRMRPFVQESVPLGERPGLYIRQCANAFTSYGRMFSLLGKLSGFTAAAFVFTACSNASGPGLASQTSASMPLTAAQLLRQTNGDRVLTIPTVMGGRLRLPALRRTSGRGYLPQAAKIPKNLLYAGDLNSGQVLLYNSDKRHPQPIGEIVDGLECPAGVAVDSSNNLYVADECINHLVGSVTVYPPGKKSPSLTISEGINQAWSVAVDSKGNVFVVNIGNDTVTGYHAGQTSPFETIPQDAFGVYSQPVGIAVDASDNVWVAVDSNSTVFEIPAGSSQPQSANLSGLNGPTGISFDASGNLYVSNFSTNSVAIYAPGSQSPIATITNGIDGPAASTVTSSGKFFVANGGAFPGSSGNIQGYPHGKNEPSSFIQIPETEGVAASPSVSKNPRVKRLSGAAPIIR